MNQIFVIYVIYANLCNLKLSLAIAFQIKNSKHSEIDILEGFCIVITNDKKIASFFEFVFIVNENFRGSWHLHSGKERSLKHD